MSDTPTRKEARAVHDVAALAQKLPGLDAARYFDFQADEEYRAALTRWPVLARLMKLAPCAPLSVHEGVEEVHEPARSL
ncbi:BcsR/BcsP family cellulose biosynthesis protein [Caballeronia sp. ATUFL_M2_KS44]|uniref:BcsR/BcsP family cellulose biosynthesis protein n=1 Tax=Caballeronia sp. ATUFL_M2_KS44 TaxID=2921767 RepID=UPI002027A33C|nr:BcsR/BcsP family cellulose biosynthesis protein [Caballeronia sp. ATUFL_M2_KS44]